ncbi:hypothetical protein POM88_025237 [Heracleum sosnowskyi]|uniref:GBF-interacting protein 1 N-terminal domain-containing protein n=1 Tax=Heracleum sosnowskyi TaxID=360622 RepID=A0AAD8I604_9APIA|nr:hypothetical protein POM88_025237 [Heracleum sosnowskyi]
MTCSEGKSDNGGGAGVEELPAATKKMVESLKEIINCSELEIYAALRECSMDPNEAVNRLLSQDPFHQVKSKRDKKKENKDLPETKFRVSSSTSYRGSRSNRGHGGSAQNSSYVPQVAVGNPNWRPSAFSNYVNMENEMSNRNVVEGKSASQNNSGYQSAWVVVPSQKSIADIVKTGGPQSSAANSLQEFPSAKNKVLKATEQCEKQGAAPDEWPSLEPSESTNLSVVRSDLPYDKSTQNLHSGNGEFKEEEEDSSKNCNDYQVGFATISDTRGIKSGNASLYGNGKYTKLGPYQSRSYTCQNEEVKDGVATSVLSETANLQQLSIQEEERKLSYEEDGPSVVIPDHLQVQSADCSHLSFGSFRSGLETGFCGSRSSRNNMEDAPIVADASVIRKTDNRKLEYYGEEAFPSAADEILAYRASEVAGTFDSASAPQSDFLRQEYPEAEAHGSQYNFTTDSTDYPYQNAHQQNLAPGYAQTSSWMQDLASFSNAMVHTDSLSSTRVAGNVRVRDLELSYSPFPAAQSVAAKYGNTASLINGSSISLEEALKTGLQSLHPAQQHLSGKPEQSDYQHLVSHKNSQPTHLTGTFANMNDYSYLPQNETYMPSAFQQAFGGNGVYHQSLAAVRPPYKNCISVSSFPQSATIPSGYGHFGDSTTISGSYAMNPSVMPAGSAIGYDDRSTRYKDNTYSISLQQDDNSAMWLHGHGSGTVSSPSNTYYSLQGQNQHPGGFGQGQQSSLNYGDTNFYNSQTGMPFDQRLQRQRNGSLGGSYVQPKQPQQIWQNSY